MRNIIYLSLLFMIMIQSCDPNRVYENNIKITDGIWAHENIVRFEVYIEDTSGVHNLYVNVRNTSFYQFSNLNLFITTTAPSGHSVKETLEVTLADDRGKWLGSGLGDIWDLQQIYKENVRFAQQGEYIFEYEQAMRPVHLPFILDVGLRVEKIKP